MSLLTGSQVVLSPQALAPRSNAEVIGVSVPELVETLKGKVTRVALGDGGYSSWPRSPATVAP